MPLLCSLRFAPFVRRSVGSRPVRDLHRSFVATSSALSPETPSRSAASSSRPHSCPMILLLLLLFWLVCSGYVTTVSAAPLLSPLRSVRSSLCRLSPRSRPPPLLRRDLVRSLPRDPLSFSRFFVATSLVPHDITSAVVWLIMWKKWYIFKIICISR